LSLEVHINPSMHFISAEAEIFTACTRPSWERYQLNMYRQSTELLYFPNITRIGYRYRISALIYPCDVISFPPPPAQVLIALSPDVNQITQHHSDILTSRFSYGTTSRKNIVKKFNAIGNTCHMYSEQTPQFRLFSLKTGVKKNSEQMSECPL
jgi:hypothetical protein